MDIKEPPLKYQEVYKKLSNTSDTNKKTKNKDNYKMEF